MYISYHILSLLPQASRENSPEIPVPWLSNYTRALHEPFLGFIRPGMTVTEHVDLDKDDMTNLHRPGR
jgi:hypothetical protein